MENDLDISGFTEGSDTGPRNNNSRFNIGDRVIVVPDNGYDRQVDGLIPPLVSMAGYFGKVTSIPGPEAHDVFIRVRLLGAVHGNRRFCDDMDWLFMEEEIEHAD